MEREIYVYSVPEIRNPNRAQILFVKRFEVKDCSDVPKIGLRVNFGFLERVDENFRSRQGEVTNGKLNGVSDQRVWVEFPEWEMSTEDLRLCLTEEKGWQEVAISLE